MTRPRRTITCARCGQERLHQARGLCSACYEAARLGGTLEQYAPAQAKIRTAEEAAEHDPGLAAFLRERRRRQAHQARLNTITTRRRAA